MLGLLVCKNHYSGVSLKVYSRGPISNILYPVWNPNELLKCLFEKTFLRDGPGYQNKWIFGKVCRWPSPPTAQNGPYLWKSCAATKSDEFFRKFIPFGSWTWTLPLHHFHWILTSNYGTNDWQIDVTSLTNTKRQWQIHKTSVTNARNNFKEILEISCHRSKNSSLTTAWESAHFSSLSL